MDHQWLSFSILNSTMGPHRSPESPVGTGGQMSSSAALEERELHSSAAWRGSGGWDGCHCAVIAGGRLC